MTTEFKQRIHDAVEACRAIQHHVPPLLAALPSMLVNTPE